MVADPLESSSNVSTDARYRCRTHQFNCAGCQVVSVDGSKNGRSFERKLDGQHLAAGWDL